MGTGHQGVIKVDTSTVSNAFDSVAEKIATDCEQVAEGIAHRFQGQNNYFRLSVEQGLQRIEGQQALRLENVIVHTKAYMDSIWIDSSLDRLVDSLLRADTAFPWQTTRENFENTVERYLRDVQSCIEDIKIDEVKREVLEAVSALELIRTTTSNEEQWLGLAKVVYDCTTIIVRDIVPKIWEPYLEDPLWPSTSKYFIQLREVHSNTTTLIERRSDQIWETSTGECLPTKWAIDLEKSLMGIQVALSSDMYNQITLSRKRQQEKEREELLLWLSSLQPERRHDDVKAKRSEGTGTWFLKAPIFTTWSNLENVEKYHVLLSSGVPGAGKTMLFSAVIEYLRKAFSKMNTAVIFIYCDYRDQPNQTIVSMIGSLAKQLVSQANSISAAVWEIYKGTIKEQKPINLENAQAIVKVILQHFDRVYICIDAWDECKPDARRQLLEFFKKVSGTTLRVFVTGRHNVEAELVSSLAGMSISKAPITAHEEDIRVCLSQKFFQDRYPEAMDETLQAQITDKIIQWSQGIFLLSTLQIETVLEHDTKRDRREALLRIPVGLSETYTTTLERIRQQPRARSERAILILTWVYYAERPLRVIELRHALAIKAGDADFDRDGMPSETALVDCCLGLVVIERETSTVRLTHFTLQEYFDNHWNALISSGHIMIANTCLTYLSFNHTNDLRKLEDSSPFIGYVGSNLGHHLRNGSDTTTNSRILALLNREDKSSILKAYLRALLLQNYNLYGNESLPLHWAAFFGVDPVAKSILEVTDVNAKAYGRIASLSLAALNGHDAVVQLLINTPGVDLNPRGDYNQTPLYWAAANGHDTVVQLVINTPGVDLNPRDHYNQTPLSQAAANGRDTVVQLLISTPGIDLNPRDHYNQTPLSQATANGHDTVVKLLISTPGVDLNLRDTNNRTLLSLAAANGHDTVVKLLISTPGVDLNPRDRANRTPLSLAAANGREKVVQLLISTLGVDLNPRDAYNQSSLSCAAANGCDTVVQLLISTPGVDLNLRDIYDRTPLSLAAANGHDTVVQLLISTPGVDLNPRDTYNQTPISWAVVNGHNDVVQLLREAINGQCNQLPSVET